MKAIIFGINSQDGYYLNSILKKDNIEVIGVSRSDGNWIKGDVKDKQFVDSIVKDTKPKYIFHLAANSTTRYHALFENHETISSGTLNILDAVKQFSSTSKVFITGSGVQFKNNGIPIKETDDFEASSPYAIARIQSVYAARFYRSLGIKVYVGYLFHHESPLRKNYHLSKKIADFAKEIKAGKNLKLEIGDLTVKKEWAFALDICEGIYALLKQDEIFECCIGTGKAYSVEYWVNLCFSSFNKNWREYIIKSQKEFIAEYPTLVSNPDTIHSLGWHEKTSIEELSIMMLQ